MWVISPDVILDSPLDVTCVLVHASDGWIHALAPLPSQAVASPRDLLYQSSRDVAFRLNQKRDSTNISSNTHSVDAAHDLLLRLSASHGNGIPHDDYDGGSTSVDSEESFPEPDPLDPADGGLPCLSRRPLGNWGIGAQGNLRSATGSPAATYFKAGVSDFFRKTST